MAIGATTGCAGSTRSGHAAPSPRSWGAERSSLDRHLHGTPVERRSASLFADHGYYRAEHAQNRSVLSRKVSLESHSFHIENGPYVRYASQSSPLFRPLRRFTFDDGR
jgi:hypothetical protein